jgi:phage shock protein C
MMKKLFRSQKDRKIAGIFGGLGEYYNIDSNLLRLIAVLVFLISGFFPVLITYVIAWLILPDEELEVKATPVETPEKPQKQAPTAPAKKRATTRKTSAKKTG